MMVIKVIARVLGLALFSVGVADMARVKIVVPEKAAYYFFGHWFEAFWEVQLPLVAVGIVLLVWSFRKT